MLYNLYKYLKKNSTNEPIVVDADTFFMQFPSELELLFNSMTIQLASDFKEDPSFKSLEMEKAIENWHDPSKTDTFIEWHDEAAKSKMIKQLPRYKVEKGKPTFEEVEEEHRDAYEEAYEENIVFYQLLLKLSKSWK